LQIISLKKIQNLFQYIYVSALYYYFSRNSSATCVLISNIGWPSPKNVPSLLYSDIRCRKLIYFKLTLVEYGLLMPCKKLNLKARDLVRRDLHFFAIHSFCFSFSYLSFVLFILFIIEKESEVNGMWSTLLLFVFIVTNHDVMHWLDFFKMICRNTLFYNMKKVLIKYNSIWIMI
jgi:hypothetical protein